MKARLIKRFEDEITQLDRELNHDLPREIQRARELGDLRENAEYHAAKERQTFVQARVSMLRNRVAEIQLMNLDRIPHDKVGFGSKVTLVEGGQRTVYELVMPEDANPDRGLVSLASPVGRALSGKEVGDEVTVPTPGGVRKLEIVSLTTIHDD
jgi:transcription elongation factor GreA